jgi:hypothetical protein
LRGSEASAGIDESIDDSIGRVLATLERSGRLDGGATGSEVTVRLFQVVRGAHASRMLVI